MKVVKAKSGSCMNFMSEAQAGIKLETSIPWDWKKFIFTFLNTES